MASLERSGRRERPSDLQCRLLDTGLESQLRQGVVVIPACAAACAYSDGGYGGDAA